MCILPVLVLIRTNSTELVGFVNKLFYNNQNRVRFELYQGIFRNDEGVDTMYKVALASSDGEKIDQHFGHTSTFRIVEVNEQTGVWEEIESISLPLESMSGVCGQGHGHHHNEERFKSAACLLEGCTYLLTERIGPKPHRILLQRGITALETDESVAKALEKLNRYVRNSLDKG